MVVDVMDADADADADVNLDGEVLTMDSCSVAETVSGNENESNLEKGDMVES